MTGIWRSLRAGGVPLATEPAPTVPSAAVLAACAREVIAAGVSGREAEALVAWLFAWHQHWPSSFAEEFGDACDDTLACASRAAVDDNRYLKLRRIAIENLSTIL